MYIVKVKKSATCIRPAWISLPPTAKTIHMPSIGSSPVTAGIAPFTAHDARAARW